MGFLKKERAPDELPELALDSPKDGNAQSQIPKKIVGSIGPPANQSEILPPKSKVIGQPAPIQKSNSEVNPSNPEVKPQGQPVHGEDYLEFSKEEHDKSQATSQNTAAAQPDQSTKATQAAEEVKSEVEDDTPKTMTGPKFFDKILNDINGEIQDFGALENWYENKFESEDIVSNMKGYWEKNKADIIIQSFGAEYKKKINERIKELQKLEEDWRGIYFSLIKKEEEMKGVEQELKSTLAEFVDLCKRKKVDKNAEN